MKAGYIVAIVIVSIIFFAILTYTLFYAINPQRRAQKSERDGVLVIDPSDPSKSTLQISTEMDRVVKTGYIILDVYLKTD